MYYENKIQQGHPREMCLNGKLWGGLAINAKQTFEIYLKTAFLAIHHELPVLSKV